MKIGTKSLLFGAHQFILHPLFLAAAWTRLFGFPWDPRLWVAFFVHDLGYWGKPNMDGEEGEAHVFFGAGLFATIMAPLTRFRPFCFRFSSWDRYKKWYCFSFYHSRAMAKKYDTLVSALGVADKYVIVITPWWLYVPLTRWTGEIREYQKTKKHQEETGILIIHSQPSIEEDRAWYHGVQSFMRTWVEDCITRRNFNPFMTKWDGINES